MSAAMVGLVSFAAYMWWFLTFRLVCWSLRQDGKLRPDDLRAAAFMGIFGIFTAVAVVVEWWLDDRSRKPRYRALVLRRLAGERHCSP